MTLNGFQFQFFYQGFQLQRIELLIPAFSGYNERNNKSESMELCTIRFLPLPVEIVWRIPAFYCCWPDQAS